MKSSKIANLVLGLIFLSLGLIILGNNLQIFNIRDFFNGWWNLYIIIPSIINLAKNKNILASIELIIISILFILISNNIIGISCILIIFLLILISIIILLIYNHKNKKEMIITNSNSNNNYKVILSGVDKELDQVKVADIKCLSILGGLSIDLSKAKVNNKTFIKCITIFGSIDIKVPKNTSVKIVGLPLLGGVNNKNLVLKNSSSILSINYICIFGGINIK